jgi:hypothetical protein
MTQLAVPAAGPATTDECPRAERVTKALLGYGMLAGPVYVAVSLAQVFTRSGFDPTRHQWSLLANGDLGWIQVANFAVAGLMLVAAAVGLRRALGGGRAARWAPRLMVAFGASLVAAAAFPADPALGFPAGTPQGQAAVTGTGLVHFAAAGVGFACIAAAAFVLARRYAADGRRAWARYSRATAVVFLAGFACVASGGGSAAANLAFTVAVLLVFAWITAISRDWYRAVAASPSVR